MTALPALCPDHAPVIRSCAEKDHVGDSDSARVAASIAAQCPQCIARRKP